MRSNVAKPSRNLPALSPTFRDIYADRLCSITATEETAKLTFAVKDPRSSKDGDHLILQLTLPVSRLEHLATHTAKAVKASTAARIAHARRELKQTS